MLAQILSTRTGRLFKGLVLGSKVATEAYAHQAARKWAGQFNVGGESADGHTPEEVEQGLYAELDKLKNADVPVDELQKVKNNFAAGEYRRLSGNMPILMQLIHADGEGDWREINEGGPKIQAVTAADVRRVANTYFAKDNRAVAIVTRKKSAADSAANDEIAALTEEQRVAWKQISARLKADTDSAKLKQTLQNVEARASTAEAKDKAFFELFRKTLTARIAELEKAKK
ncbi:MAG: insulinase family protein [Verrucomicrobia bacterium]|nr:insulinase family protein [Verrucomicrobiota bacterium]